MSKQGRRSNPGPVPATADASASTRRKKTGSGKLLAELRDQVEDHVWETYIAAFERYADMTARHAAWLRNKGEQPSASEVAEIVEDLCVANAWITRIVKRNAKAHPELAKPDPPAG
jgi:hypothetical protein